MTLTCHLNFPGNCREAIYFYGEIFQVSPRGLTYSALPVSPALSISQEQKGPVLHGELDICGNRLQFADSTPEPQPVTGTHISISLTADDKELLEHWFAGLSAGGAVHIPMEKTFYSGLYGFVTDKYGMSWQLNYMPAQ